MRIGKGVTRALLDSGMFYALRLDTRALRRLGQAAMPDAWVRAGALPLRVGEAGGKAMTAYVAALPAVQLDSTPPLRFERPCAVLAEAEAGADERHAAVIGAGMLASCSRVGIDPEALVLELELPADAAQGPDGAWVIPSRGAYAGCSVRPGHGAGPDASPPMLRFAMVAAGSPAHAAGLRDGDRLLSVDGEPAERIAAADLQRRLWLQPGRSLDLAVMRGDGQTLRVRLP